MGPAEFPIGVFDSGVGGISTLRAIRRALPSERLIYVADSAHAPYGDKSPDFITRRSTAIMEFLLEQGAKAVVAACNTATGVVIAQLRATFDCPIIGLEPAIKPAVAHTRSGVVGVLATERTLSSDKFLDLVARHRGAATLLLQACPGLVECVESGDLSSDATSALVRSFVEPLTEKGADTLVLGCTHYVLIKDLIQHVAPEATILDSSDAVATHLRQRLGAHDLLASNNGIGSEEFWTTGSLDHARRLVAGLWTADASVRRIAI